MGAACCFAVVRTGQKIFTAPRLSDCEWAGYACTDSDPSGPGLFEPEPLVPIPLVSVLWRDPALRSPAFVRPVGRSPITGWYPLSLSGLFRRSGKPGDRLFGSCQLQNKRHRPDSSRGPPGSESILLTTELSWLV